MAEERGPRMTLVLLDKPEVALEAQYNPEEVTESIGAVWNSVTVPGFSGTVRQFSNTKDAAIKFTLHFNAMGTGGRGPAGLQYARKFLKKCCLPRGAARTINLAAPARLLLVWPNWFSMTTVLEAGELTTTAWATSGAPRLLSVDVSCTQVRDVYFSGEGVTLDDAEEWYEGDPEFGP